MDASAGDGSTSGVATALQRKGLPFMYDVTIAIQPDRCMFYGTPWRQPGALGTAGAAAAAQAEEQLLSVPEHEKAAVGGQHWQGPRRGGCRPTERSAPRTASTRSRCIRSATTVARPTGVTPSTRRRSADQRKCSAQRWARGSKSGTAAPLAGSTPDAWSDL